MLRLPLSPSMANHWFSRVHLWAEWLHHPCLLHTGTKSKVKYLRGSQGYCEICFGGFNIHGEPKCPLSSILALLLREPGRLLAFLPHLCVLICMPLKKVT